jgi:hypothetical protein
MQKMVKTSNRNRMPTKMPDTTPGFGAQPNARRTGSKKIVNAQKKSIA